MTTITYRTATEEDINQIDELIQLHFVPDEPILRSWHLPQRKKNDKKRSGLCELVLSGLSTIAEDAEGTIVGLRVSKSMETLDTQHDDDNELLKLFNFIAAKADVFNTFEVDRIVKGVLLCVHRDHREKGIATRLYVENMKLAAQLHYPLYVSDCTNKFTSLACEKLQMTKVYELFFKDYVDGDGQPIFKVAYPHDKITVFAKRL